MIRIMVTWLSLFTIFNIVAALKNPIIPGWNPDGHVLRVGDTYYLAVSSFLTFPAIPIYRPYDLSDWEIVSHALDSPTKMPLHGVRHDNGVYAPSLSHIDGEFYMTSMTMWGSDAKYRSFPRIFWTVSSDLETWSEVIWAEPYGIDPHLFKDPKSDKIYLTMMGFNNAYERIWGISQCQVDLMSGKCLSSFKNIWNGTLPVNSTARPEGPKLFLKDDWYYLLIAEGGTGSKHRAAIARSKSPEGPWDSSPTNPLLFNSVNFTVGNTGHATFADTPDGRWFATFLARRYVDEWSPLGREAFFAPLKWRNDGWPVVNGGKPVLLSQSYDYGPDSDYPPAAREESFNKSKLDDSWYQLRSPYSRNYFLTSDAAYQRNANETTGGLIFEPNVYTLSDRDTPAAILPKQTSINMTFTATLLPTKKGLGPFQSVGVSVYSHEGAHQDIGVRGCVNMTGQCIFVDSTINATGPGIPPQTLNFPINVTAIPQDLNLHMRAEPCVYRLGYSLGRQEVTWVHKFTPAVIPANFDGAMMALFASGNGFPWPPNAPQVGFSSAKEEYFDEGYGDLRVKCG